MTDWNAVSAHLSRISSAWEHAEQLDVSNEKMLLEGRARELAASPEEISDLIVRILTFSLAEEIFALPLHHSREIVPVSDWTPVPGTPSLLLGLFNLRGAILPLFDLRSVVGHTSQPAAFVPGSLAIVLGRDSAEVGFATDGVGKILMLEQDEILEAPDALRQERDFIQGITKDGVILLNGDKLLDDPRLFLGREATP